MSDATVVSHARLRECPVCGLFQVMPSLSRRSVACCARCGSVLRQDRTDPAGRALALATAGLLLFALAVSLPFLRLDLGGGQQTSLVTGPVALENIGMPELALVVLGTTMLAPLAKMLAMVWVLVGLRLRSPPGHLAVVFRLVEVLTPWSMIEVFMLGVFVAYTKLGDLAPVHVGGGVYALGVLMLTMAAADAALDHEAIWERLEPAWLGRQAPPPPGQRIACDSCGQVTRRPHGAVRAACPRCGSYLRDRKPDSLTRSWALLIAASVLYIPANTLPVLTVIQLGRGAPSTILGGVEELGAAGMWPLAALVFVASIAVPVLKLIGLSVLLLSTRRRSRGRLAERTLLYKIVECVGRWSMIDVFMISILTAMVQAGTLATVVPGPGVLCFCAVVILTMLAANSFDPRLMWDAAEMPKDPSST
jgi:paraquat-inducible protein A